MADIKQRATQAAITIKVQKSVTTVGDILDMAPVPNKWDNSLDDLRDDLDLQQVFTFPYCF